MWLNNYLSGISYYSYKVSIEEVKSENDKSNCITTCQQYLTFHMKLVHEKTKVRLQPVWIQNCLSGISSYSYKDSTWLSEVWP